MENRKIASVVVAMLTLSSMAGASEILKDFDSLGGNKVLLEKAKALNPETSVGIVQDRVVNRRNRLEISPDVSYVMGGDAYLSTKNLGATIHYHITPHWSLGIRYNSSYSTLKDEAKYLIYGSGPGLVPAVDYPRSQVVGLLNWYPIYGKMNLYDLGVTHFDVYVTLGGGQITLNSGPTRTYTAGGGVGLWFSQHLAARLELRWQGYNAIRDEQGTYMNTTVAGFQVGYIL